MTPPTCKTCDNPLENHSMRELDICVAKDKGYVTKVKTAVVGFGYGIELSQTTKYYIVNDFGEKPLPNYSQDDSVAVKELWEDGWLLIQVINGVQIRDCRKVYDSYKIYPVADTIIAEEKTLALALTYARLTAKGELNAKKN